MIKLICSKCGNFAYKIEWRVRPTRITEDGRFSKKDFVVSASYNLFGECEHCKHKDLAKGGNFRWVGTPGIGWKELDDSDTHEYEF